MHIILTYAIAHNKQSVINAVSALCHCYEVSPYAAVATEIHTNICVTCV